MTEASVWAIAIAMGILLAIACAVASQWLGVIAALLSAVNAWAARHFLVRWKPEAKAQ